MKDTNELQKLRKSAFEDGSPSLSKCKSVARPHSQLKYRSQKLTAGLFISKQVTGRWILVLGLVGTKLDAHSWIASEENSGASLAYSG